MERNYSDDVPNPKEKERAEILHRILMERIQNGENPMKGNIVKRGAYAYQQQGQENQNLESLNYEAKVNEILESIAQNIQDEIDDLVNTQKQMKEEEEALKRRLEEVLRINNPQTRVDKDKAEGLER